MNKQIQRKWVKALRSGEFKQTDSTLYDRKTDGYCCLGVLAAVVSGKRGEEIIDGVHTNLGGTFLRHNFCDDIGLDWEVDAENLASMNDDGCTFDQIAYCVEQL